VVIFLLENRGPAVVHNHFILRELALVGPVAYPTKNKIYLKAHLQLIRSVGFGEEAAFVQHRNIDKAIVCRP